MRFVGGGQDIYSFVDDYYCFGIVKFVLIVMVNGMEKNVIYILKIYILFLLNIKNCKKRI